VDDVSRVQMDSAFDLSADIPFARLTHRQQQLKLIEAY
jgi:hypothetical protein